MFVFTEIMFLQKIILKIIQLYYKYNNIIVHDTDYLISYQN